MGDECNLMCRMCSGNRNTRIKKDKVSSAWNKGFLETKYCWKNDQLTILPLQVINGVYTGFYQLNFASSPTSVWTNGRAGIEFTLGKDTHVTHMSLRLKGDYPSDHKLCLTLNDVIHFNGLIHDIKEELILDITDIPWGEKFVLNLISSTFTQPDTLREVGICVQQIKLFKKPQAVRHTEMLELIFSRFLDNKPLHQQDKFLFGELLASPNLIQKIHFTGGEPLIIPRVKDILDFLVNKGVANNIHITFNTNFTVISEELIKLLSNFRRVSMFMSIDGTEKVYEYIRYPATWQLVKENIQRVRNYKHIELSVAPLVQVYNLLNIVDLCIFFDNLRIDYVFNVIKGPKWLRIDLIPPHARNIACNRLRKYAENLASSHAKSKNQVLSLAALVKEDTDEDNKEMLLKFMRFTNELDRSRSQSIRESLPELFQAIEDSGAHWEM
jgi:glutamate-1-semialdehyde 2,1-aminomutase